MHVPTTGLFVGCSLTRSVCRQCDVADSKGWKELTEKYPMFFAEARNVLLGFSVDGVNPFDKASTKSISMGCVPFVFYNLPPQMRCKYNYMQLWGIMDGKPPSCQQYLSVLVDDLELLWNSGVGVWDAAKDESVMLHAMMVTMLCDYPGYGEVACQYASGI